MGDTVEQLVRTVTSQQEGHRFEQADKLVLLFPVFYARLSAKICQTV